MCTIPNPLTLRNCARNLFDLQSIPSRYFFELLSKFTEDQLEKEKFVEFTTAEGQQVELDWTCTSFWRLLIDRFVRFLVNWIDRILKGPFCIFVCFSLKMPPVGYFLVFTHCLGMLGWSLSLRSHLWNFIKKPFRMI